MKRTTLLATNISRIITRILSDREAMSSPREFQITTLIPTSLETLKFAPSKFVLNISEVGDIHTILQPEESLVGSCDISWTSRKKKFAISSNLFEGIVPSFKQLLFRRFHTYQVVIAKSSGAKGWLWTKPNKLPKENILY